MSEQGIVRISDCAIVLMGQSPPSSACSDNGDGLPFIQGNAEFGARNPAPRLRCSIPTRTAESGDLLLSVRAPVGALNQATCRTVIGRGLSAIRFPSDDQGYAWHALAWSSNKLNRVAQGSTFSAVSRKDVEELEIPWHGSGNRMIAEVLNAVDDAIANRLAIVAKLKQIRTGLLHDLLTRGLDENGELRDPDADPEVFRKTPVGRIPSDWDLVLVEQAGEVRLGRQRCPAHETGQHMRPYLRVANVFDGFIDYSDVLMMNFNPYEQKTYGLLPGDVLLNEGQSLELVGRSAIYQGPPGSYCFQNTLVRFRCSDTAIPEYCQAVFHYWLHTGKFTLVAKQTTSVAHLGAERFAKMPFPRPSPAEQERIVGRLAMTAAIQDVESAELRKLTQIKSGLMSDLLTGRVRVSSDLDLP